jgi:hypothetical protein
MIKLQMSASEQVVAGKSLLIRLADEIAGGMGGALGLGTRWVAEGPYYSLPLTAGRRSCALKVSETILRDCAVEAQEWATEDTPLNRKVRIAFGRGLRQILEGGTDEYHVNFETLLFR